MLTQQEAFQSSPLGEEVKYCTLNELIDSLIALRDKESAGDCPVMVNNPVFETRLAKV